MSRADKFVVFNLCHFNVNHVFVSCFELCLLDSDCGFQKHMPLEHIYYFFVVVLFLTEVPKASVSLRPLTRIYPVCCVCELNLPACN